MAVTDPPDTLQSNSPPTAPFVPITSRAWWHRHLDPEERRRVMEELAMTRIEHWTWRFTTMLTLSVVVAVMGLSADSAAVVIGAMLLAPLMQPVLATAASLSMSLVRKSFRSLFKVLAATAWCVAIAYLLSMLLPDGALSGEVEARTRPDIRDLVVALAAGAAGAYATVRKDVSSSLPGVAVAVALVPPLAAIGITLEANQYKLAIGAVLLYSTNLAAIVFAGVMVFIATGFVPPRRLANTALQLIVAAVIALALVVVIAVPLLDRTTDAVDAAKDQVAARSIVDAWLDGADLQPQVDVQDERVLVQLRGFEAPPDDTVLRQELRREFGESVSVNVEWVRTERATTTTQPTPTDDEALLGRIDPVIDRWLDDHDEGGGYDREKPRLVDGVIVIAVAGPGEPPSVDDLALRLEAEVRPGLDVSLDWTRRERITPGVAASPIEATVERLGPIVQTWADGYDVVVTALGFDGERVTIEAIGQAEPPIDALIDEVRAAVGEREEGDDVPVDVLFTAQRRLTTTTTFLLIDVFGDGEIPTTSTTAPTGGPPPTTQGG